MRSVRHRRSGRLARKAAEVVQGGACGRTGAGRGSASHEAPADRDDLLADEHARLDRDDPCGGPSARRQGFGIEWISAT
jgi:hypothetical protein